MFSKYKETVIFNKSVKLRENTRKLKIKCNKRYAILKKSVEK